MADHRINIKVETCTECNGTAKVYSPHSIKPETCPKCKGQGFTDREELIVPEEYKEEIGLLEITCAISEWETIPDYYKICLSGKTNSGEVVRVYVECDVIANALGLEKNAYLYQAFTYLFRCFRKGDIKENIRKAIHFMGMWVQRCKLENKGLEK